MSISGGRCEILYGIDLLFIELRNKNSIYSNYTPYEAVKRPVANQTVTKEITKLHHFVTAKWWC